MKAAKTLLLVGARWYYSRIQRAQQYRSQRPFNFKCFYSHKNTLVPNPKHLQAYTVQVDYKIN